MSSPTLAYPSTPGTGTYAIVNASTALTAPEPTSTACIILGLGCFATRRHRRLAIA